MKITKSPASSATKHGVLRVFVFLFSILNQKNEKKKDKNINQWFMIQTQPVLIPPISVVQGGYGLWIEPLNTSQ